MRQPSISSTQTENCLSRTTYFRRCPSVCSSASKNHIHSSQRAELFQRRHALQIFQRWKTVAVQGQFEGAKKPSKATILTRTAVIILSPCTISPFVFVPRKVGRA